MLIVMPGFSARNFSYSASMFLSSISERSSLLAIEGMLPSTSGVTSMIRRMKVTVSPGAGSSSSLDMAQKPSFR